MGPRPANRGWIWYFAVVAVLAVVFVIVLARYNLSQQLSADKLAAAKALWDRAKPRDYDLEYTQTGGAAETRKVKVRGGRVVSVVREGGPLEPRLYAYSDMDAWFGFLEDYVKGDAEPGKPRVYSVATFDPEDGHIVRYVRRVMGTTERLEVNFKLERRSPGTGPH